MYTWITLIPWKNLTKHWKMHSNHTQGNALLCVCKHDKKSEFVLQRRGKSFPTYSVNLHIFGELMGPYNILAYGELTTNWYFYFNISKYLVHTAVYFVNIKFFRFYVHGHHLSFKCYCMGKYSIHKQTLEFEETFGCHELFIWESN